MELVDEETIDLALGGLDWILAGAELVKVVRRHDFVEALAFVNEVGGVAEAVGHHPDIELHWNTVTLRLSTHSLGGITDVDLALARDIDAIG
jgi:4a-hydroxytetrahydrobiopterin dehydratase